MHHLQLLQQKTAAKSVKLRDLGSQLNDSTTHFLESMIKISVCGVELGFVSTELFTCSIEVACGLGGVSNDFQLRRDKLVVGNAL